MFRLFCRWTWETGESQALCFGPRSFIRLPSATSKVCGRGGPCCCDSSPRTVFSADSVRRPTVSQSSEPGGAVRLGRSEDRPFSFVGSQRTEPHSLPVHSLFVQGSQIQLSNYPIINYSIFQLSNYPINQSINPLILAGRL